MKKYVIGVLFLSMTTHLFALGIGNIELRSHLNEYLDARIPLTFVDSNDLQQIRATLASFEQLKKAKIELTPLIRHLHFQPVSAGKDSYIEVKSEELVKDTIVEFIIDINWPGGQILKHYTLFLDLPNSMQY